MPKTERPFSPSANARSALPKRVATFHSHVGGRQEQQDAAHVWQNAANGNLFIVVCDGVGGSRSGGEASAIIVQTAAQLWRERGEELPDPPHDLLSLSRVAHDRIKELAREGEKRAPASTIVALYLTDTEAHWVHAGDSRLYFFRDGQIVSRTRDHSVVQILVDQGEIKEKDMGNHPDQGRLLQSLGTQEYRDPVYASAAVQDLDGFILCTDGFWERTPQAAMASLLDGDPQMLPAFLRRAVHRAVRANGPSGDNVTAAVVAPLQAPRRLAGWSTSQISYLLPLISVLALGGAFLLFALARKTPHPTPAKTSPAATNQKSNQGEKRDQDAPANGTPPAASPSATATPSSIHVPGDSNVHLIPSPSPTPSPRGGDSGRPQGYPDMNKPEESFLDPSGIRFWLIESNDAKKVVYMAEQVVTEGQWQRTTNEPLPKDRNAQSRKQGVSLQQAEGFANALTKQRRAMSAPSSENWRYRLPDFAEFERAQAKYGASSGAGGSGMMPLRNLAVEPEMVQNDQKCFVMRSSTPPGFDHLGPYPEREKNQTKDVGFRLVLEGEKAVPAKTASSDSSPKPEDTPTPTPQPQAIRAGDYSGLDL